MLVHWVALPSMHPIVKWGLVDGANLDEAQAQGTTYQRNEMCGSPANSVRSPEDISYSMQSFLSV